MNKTELIAQVAEKTGLSKKDSELAVNASLETITETLIQGEKVQLVGFGAFDVKERGVRMGRNPKTKKEIEIPASRVPQFKAGKALKEEHSAQRLGRAAARADPRRCPSHTHPQQRRRLWHVLGRTVAVPCAARGVLRHRCVGARAP